MPAPASWMPDPEQLYMCDHTNALFHMVSATPWLLSIRITSPPFSTPWEMSHQRQAATTPFFTGYPWHTTPRLVRIQSQLNTSHFWALRFQKACASLLGAPSVNLQKL
jgi:hypothetical protein